MSYNTNPISIKLGKSVSWKYNCSLFLLNKYKLDFFEVKILTYLTGILLVGIAKNVDIRKKYKRVEIIEKKKKFKF